MSNFRYVDLVYFTYFFIPLLSGDVGLCDRVCVFVCILSLFVHELSQKLTIGFQLSFVELALGQGRLHWAVKQSHEFVKLCGLTIPKYYGWISVIFFLFFLSIDIMLRKKGLLFW